MRKAGENGNLIWLLPNNWVLFKINVDIGRLKWRISVQREADTDS